jgi:hypothetical protein
MPAWLYHTSALLRGLLGNTRVERWFVDPKVAGLGLGFPGQQRTPGAGELDLQQCAGRWQWGQVAGSCVGPAQQCWCQWAKHCDCGA